MISILGRVFAELRAWLGLNDPSESRLHQAHGWLLPVPVTARARGTEATARGRAGARPDSRQH
jgi:hypothetical protein